MTIVEFAHGSPGYLELVRLRDLHLRQPIGLRLRDEDCVGEEGHRHFALMEDDLILGGLIANPLGSGSAKLRQMWIDPNQRGQGLGQELLEEVEQRLASEGVRHFVLHSRENAAGFYRNSGYHAVGGIFTEVGRPHLKMEKRLE
ncbi:GNAT family N-acetyltransferase [Luteolibacter arcticus]|uniref:GNAT family N-acetyltransferase n=1 Tax=Luteolibacter arcticus TaxID=1581411 RepID=A0ABT3GCP1_9BACT|nr:GNAT family N-acetyltransferase [Luteolibacter arcticus]MCW1921178.1 GNAT family N-acetyltransferase [Luteolibacter arcticus]